MKLSLTGPQPITLFKINKDSQIPASAKVSSVTAPQGYYCTDTDSLHLFIKGVEYTYIGQDKYLEAIDSTSVQTETVATEDVVVDNTITELVADVKDMDKRLHVLEDSIYKPLVEALTKNERSGIDDV